MCVTAWYSILIIFFTYQINSDAILLGKIPFDCESLSYTILYVYANINFQRAAITHNVALAV